MPDGTETPGSLEDLDLEKIRYQWGKFELMRSAMQGRQAILSPDVASAILDRLLEEDVDLQEAT